MGSQHISSQSDFCLILYVLLVYLGTIFLMFIVRFIQYCKLYACNSQLLAPVRYSLCAYIAIFARTANSIFVFIQSIISQYWYYPMPINNPFQIFFTDPIVKMKITDMNMICLEECLEYLELKDLLDVANANKRLREAAQFVYLRKYSQKTISTNLIELNHGISVFKEFIEICNFKMLLQFFRCFGQLIKYMNIEFTDLSTVKTLRKISKQRILFQLNEYCSESLIKINFYNVKNDELKLLTKPFTKVQEVLMEKSYLTEIGGFKRIFPNIQKFKYKNTNIELIDDIGCMVDHFPHLKCFSFLTETFLYKKERIAKMLRLNPQLEKLSLQTCSSNMNDCFFDWNIFRNVIEPMQNLEELDLRGNFVNFSNFDQKIHLKNVKKLEIIGIQLKYPFIFPQLEYLRLSHNQKLNADFYDFIDQHPTIKKIYLRIREQELMSVDDVVRLMSTFKLCKTIDLHLNKSDVKLFFNELQVRLRDEWRVSIINCIFLYVPSDILHLERVDYLKSQSK